MSQKKMKEKTVLNEFISGLHIINRQQHATHDTQFTLFPSYCDFLNTWWQTLSSAVIS